MQGTILIKNGQIVNRGTIQTKDIFIKNGRIERIDNQIDSTADRVLDATGLYVIPGIIDDQVHFREPGLTHKATIGSEARAAVAGGVTSFMEMPNVSPPTVTQTLLTEKYAIGARTSLANYSFYMGATNDNLEEVLKTDSKTVCGVKIFMGSSTGNMLVDNTKTLEKLFGECPMLIATHCEDEATVRQNMALALAQVEASGRPLEASQHPIIRSREACYLSSSMAVAMAEKLGTRLHILHITTAEEVALFSQKPLSDKRITSEVCVHHLYFNDADYAVLGNKIKCNPAIKTENDQKALLKALLDGHIDIVATDHAPHTMAEKAKPYAEAPAGLPLVQSSLGMMLRFYHEGALSLETIVEKMCHAPAECFGVLERGYLDEGQWADIAIVDIHKPVTITADNIHYHCGWSPLEGQTLRGSVETTIVSGHIAYHQGQFNDSKMGERLLFKGV